MEKSMNTLIESKTVRALFVALVMGASLGGCATIEGAGEDIESAGDAIEDTAEDASN
ncbi:entericidin A/B family lipoprotein [Alteromonas hispanica]|jgi:predicted small secreted protein|uniref:Entericidin A/B family lipoprotein n=2 Tax=Alteromonas TaxID=226 RepID=A0A6L9MW63_9ALTE|nr:entericidin, EcnA/B family [Alteromonas sp. MB-3u-76]NDW22297.1 entericidin A/B family lipoprotein [Alteromonas hispanica]